MTKGDKSGILHKSPKASGSLKRRLRGREVEKTSKKIQKPLDKRETLWYNTKVAENDSHKKRAKKSRVKEKSWKNLKKVLDKSESLWYNKQAIRKRRAYVPWKLNNKRREKKEQILVQFLFTKSEEKSFVKRLRNCETENVQQSKEQKLKLLK